MSGENYTRDAAAAAADCDVRYKIEPGFESRENGFGNFALMRVFLIYL